MNVHTHSLRRRLSGFAVILSMVAGLLVSGPATAASAAEAEVVFDGGGWGHGVGLSQFGAYGMAVQGSTYTQILTHYYSGSTVKTLGDVAPLWVNLEQDFSSLTLRVDGIGKDPASVTVARGDKTWKAHVGATIAISATANGCKLVVDNPGKEPFSISSKGCNVDLSWYKWTSKSATPSTKLVIVGCTNADWNTTPTSYPECQYARGMLHLRKGSGGLDLSAEMQLDDYVLGISEMPYYWGDAGGMEALKAQAVAARSYAREIQLVRGNPATNNCAAWCHVRDTTWDQRYVGWGHGNANWVAAVQATSGQVATHSDAPTGVVRAYYFSSSAGRTESAHERFTDSAPRAYLTAVGDLPAVDGTVNNPFASWTVSIAPNTVAKAVGLDKLTAVTVTKTRPSSGSAAVVTFEGKKNGSDMSIDKTGTWTRLTFGLRSEFFTVDYDTPKPKKAGGPTPSPGTDPVSGSSCVEVQAGDGWWTTTVRLGLAGSRYPEVKAANPNAENAAGFLIIGAQVCSPDGEAAPAPSQPTETPATASCTVVRRGEGWWHQAMKLGISGSQWPTLKAANAGAVAANGYLKVGATVCLPGESQPAPVGQCTTAKPGEGWIAVGARLGWPYSEWKTLAEANPQATNAAGYLMVGAEVCAPG